MKKQFLYALLWGAVAVSAETFTSCSNDDIDELKSRVTVIEGKIGELKEQLANALTTGASITKVEKSDAGTYTLTLSDGQVIVIEPSTGGGGAGGGSSVGVVVTDDAAVITVDGEEYKIPLGATVNSLVYVPMYADGKEVIDSAPIEVSFLARPALTSLDGATFEIAESHKLQTRAANGDDFVVMGAPKLEGDYIKVQIKALGAEADATYAVSLQMTLKGTVIGSNFFNITIGSGFSFKLIDIDNTIAVKDAYSPTKVNATDGTENTAYAITMNGATLLESPNFNDLFTATLPEGYTLQIAPAGRQPEGKAQEKAAMLKKSLGADGTWKFSERPGTSFNESDTRKGFLLEVVKDYQVKAQVYVVINDELADVDFTDNGLIGNFEAEWGGTEKSVPLGASKLNFPQAIYKYETDIPTIHGGKDGFFAKWADYMIKSGDEVLISMGTSGFEMGDLAKKYAKDCRGVFYFFRGFAVYVPAPLATVVDGDKTVYVDVNGKKYDGSEGYGYDGWLGQPNDYVNDPVGFYKTIKDWGFGDFSMDEKTGDFNFPASYTGYGLRIAFSAGYEYAYGVKALTGKKAAGAEGGDPDQLGMLFINRRVAPEGATMPAPKMD